MNKSIFACNQNKKKMDFFKYENKKNSDYHLIFYQTISQSDKFV